MKRQRLESQAAASSSHGTPPVRKARPVDLTGPNAEVSDGLRSFIVDHLWKHKKLTDKDICSLCHYITIAGGSLFV
jgi:hypothetical protein